jgi:ABC-type polysaccharide/polyol phosphate export permease
MQPFIAVLPLTPLISALRAVMLEGAGLESLTRELAIIIAWGGVTFALALRWFRWTS